MAQANNHKKMSWKLPNLFMFSVISITFIAILISAYVWLSREYAYFNEKSREQKEIYIASQKDMLRNEVKKVADYVDYKKLHTEKRLKKNIKERIYEAYNIAKYIYDQNVDKKTIYEIQQMIHDALFVMRWDEGRGYYFVMDTDGIMTIHANNPELEYTSVWDLQDSKGKYLIREFIYIATNDTEGYSKYYWKKPGNKKEMFPKYSYVKLFEPLNWVIGTGEYLDKVEKDIQNESIERISKIRFGKDGYIFITDYSGNVLMHDIQKELVGKHLWDIEDVNGVKFVQDMRKAVENPEGGFVQYTWHKPSTGRPSPKLTFSMGVNDWQWMLGAGTYIDEIDDILEKREAVLKNKVYKNISEIIIFFTIIFFVVVLITIAFSEKLKNELKVFIAFFSKSVDDYEKIDEQKLFIEEFRILSQYANDMIEERTRIEKEKSQAMDALWGEMELAKKIQTVLVPEKPAISGYEISCIMNPADEVGGDYYDVINVADRDWIIIGDVSGHGVTAGLIMMMAQATIDTAVKFTPDITPSELLTKINTIISKNILKLGESKHMTIIALVSLKDGSFLYSGLHEDILIYRSDLQTVETIETSGMWIGLEEDIKGLQHDDELQLNVGDAMLLFTDGITESWKKKGEQIDLFGDERLKDVFCQLADLSTEEIKNGILEELEPFECNDDVTMVILKRH